MKRSLPLALAVAVYAAAVIVWLAVDKRVPRQAFDEFSAENTSEKGLSLARRYLAGRGRRVSLLERPVDARFLPANGVVFRAGKLFSFFDLINAQDEAEREAERQARQKPKQNVRKDDKQGAKKDEKPKPAKAPVKKKPSPLLDKLKRKHATPILDAEEEEWVRGGGRLILAMTNAFGSLDIRGTTSHRATKVFPIWRGIDAIDEPEPRTIVSDGLLRTAHTLYTIGSAPAIARIPLGAGDVILIPAPELFTNEHIARNLPLLTALAGERRPVFFDEVVHGQNADDGVLPLMKDWNLGPFLLLGLLGFALALWRNGVSVGPREDDFRDTRSEAVDMVDSLGALYERSMTDGEAIALYHHALTRVVAAQTGLRGDPLHRRVNDLTASTRVPDKGEKLDEETFARSMKKLNEAFSRIEQTRG